MSNPVSPVPQQPWAQRLAEASAGRSGRAPRPLRPFLELPFPSALFGAAVYAGQPCLLHNTQLLLEGALGADEDLLRTNCWTLIQALGNALKTRDIPGDKCYTLFFQLLVEPFALMNQCTAFHPAPAPSPSANAHIGK